jgi:hypothetical protein
MSEQFFDIEEQTNDTLEKERDNIPSYGSQEWHDYIMSKFETKELIDGNPTCAGLRRVAEDVLGSIVISRPVQIFPSLDPNGSEEPLWCLK